MTDVIKSNGKREQFSEQKVKNSIESAVKDAGLNPQQKSGLINNTVQDVKQQVMNKDEVRTNEIRDIVIDDLEQDEEQAGETTVAQAWRNYEQEHGIMYEESGRRRR